MVRSAGGGCCVKPPQIPPIAIATATTRTSAARVIQALRRNPTILPDPLFHSRLFAFIRGPFLPSEQHSEPELQLPVALRRAADRAEIRRLQRCARNAELRGVEEIEGLGAELGTRPFPPGQAEIPLHRKVYRARAGAGEEIAA